MQERPIKRLVNTMFRDLISKTMEVYMDDMLVKSRAAADHVEHLGQMFSILRRYQMKLNPLKYSFEVRLGKFTGYMVNQRALEANPEKIKALQGMSSR